MRAARARCGEATGRIAVDLKNPAPAGNGGVTVPRCGNMILRPPWERINDGQTMVTVLDGSASFDLPRGRPERARDRPVRRL
jgi:hypothetical protein